MGHEQGHTTKLLGNELSEIVALSLAVRDPDALHGELEQLHDVGLLRQSLHARLLRAELEALGGLLLRGVLLPGLLAVLALGRRLDPLDLRVELHVGLAQELAELLGADALAGLAQGLLVLDDELRGQTDEPEAVGHEGCLHFLGEFLAEKRRSGPLHPGRLPGTFCQGENGVPHRGLEGSLGQDRLQPVAPDGEEREVTRHLHAREQHHCCTVEDQAAHALHHGPLKQHAVPLLVQRRLRFLLIWQWQGLSRGEERKAAVDPGAAVAAQGGRQADADPAPPQLVLGGLHPGRCSALGEQRHAVRLVELRLHDVQHGLVAADPVGNGPLGIRRRVGLLRDNVLLRDDGAEHSGLQVRHRLRQPFEERRVCLRVLHLRFVRCDEFGSVVELQPAQVAGEEEHFVRHL
mmetsp:Transcript_37486/g.107098  ORF Transcript_37486/g.107098 Transcript_37486/m.107098 type:complete len:406 (+) Transcript_37486:2363-3580(+)